MNHHRARVELLAESVVSTAEPNLRLRFPILVIKYAKKVDKRVGATELIIKRKPKVVER